MIDRKPGKDKIIIKIMGVMVNILVHMDPEKYGPNVFYEKLNKVLYIEVIKAIYGILKISSIGIY